MMRSARLFFVAVTVFQARFLEATSCRPGQSCTDVGARCCKDEKTYYCIGNYGVGMSWQLAPGEECLKCEKSCFAVYDPKCGTDGITYQNQCYLENAKCRIANLKLSHDGACIGPGACPLGCPSGYQISYSTAPQPGSFPVPACSGAAAFCVPTTDDCMKTCPPGYYMVNGYDTTAVQYSSCGSSIWCKPSPLLPSQCQGVMCRNNGYLTYTSNSCSCNCPAGYYGDDCGNRYDANCGGRTCANGAALVADATGCKCACGAGYTGPYCQDIVGFNSCGGMVCHNGGILTRGSQGCTCTCLNGYFGKECEKHPNCPNMQCQNGGFVTTVNYKCECACPFGYFGPQCEREHFGVWINIRNKFFDLCLDHDQTGNIFVDTCKPGSDSQIFLVKKNTLMTWDEMCLTIEGPHRTGNVALHPCTYMTDQYWVIQEPAIKTFDKLCLDVAGGIFNGGRNLIVRECRATENQAWELQPAMPPVGTGGCPASICQIDPCAVQQCPLFPMAQRVPDWCTCKCHFHINGHEVSCNPIRFPDTSAAWTTSR